jgi:hypothetical protein
MFKSKKIQLNKNNFEKYNAAKAHQEMVCKSGSGFNKLLEEIENKNYNIELLNQKIARLNNEIFDMEKQIVKLSICYKFKTSFLYIEINKSFFIQKFKKIIYILNVIYIIKFKNIIILLNLIFFLQHLKIL